MVIMATITMIICHYYLENYDGVTTVHKLYILIITEFCWHSYYYVQVIHVEFMFVTQRPELERILIQVCLPQNLFFSLFCFLMTSRNFFFSGLQDEYVASENGIIDHNSSVSQYTYPLPCDLAACPKKGAESISPLHPL